MRHFPFRELGYATGFVVLLAAVYLLSGGPMTYLSVTGQLPGDGRFWDSFFGPIQWASDNIGPYGTYIDSWTPRRHG